MASSFFLTLDVPRVPDDLANYRLKHIDHPGKVIPLHITMGGLCSGDQEPTPEILDRLSAVCAKIRPIELELVCTCAFLSSKVLWLYPNPMGELEDFYERLRTEFGYRDVWHFPSFHATVGLCGDYESLIAAQAEFADQISHLLPLTVLFESVTVWRENEGQFSEFSKVPFGR